MSTARKWSCTARRLLIGIIPESLGEELEHHYNSHSQTHEQIVEWCKGKATKARSKVLAAAKRRQIPGRVAPLISGGASSPVDDVLCQPCEGLNQNLVQRIVNALKQDRGRSPGRGRDSRRSPSASPSTRQRSTSPGGFKPKGKIVFRGGCNHCGQEDHQRKD